MAERGIGSSIAGRGRKEKLNRAPEGENWVWVTRAMLESDAWGALSLAARRVIDRIMVEHLAHAGTENGNLVVTYADFRKFGIRPNSLKKAINLSVSLGFIIITEKGRSSVGPDRWPSRYALGWLPLKDGTPAANRWKAWRRTRPNSPIPGNIESSNGSDTRETRRKHRPLVTQAILAPSNESDTGKLAEINNSPVTKAILGKMNFAPGASAGRC
jgi:hypothetical protein